MNPTTRRRLASWVLLAVYLPMLLIASLHIHETQLEEAPECAECVQHQCHGHLTPLSGGIHQCVLCQILTLTYVATVTGMLLCRRAGRRVAHAVLRQSTCQTSLRLVSLRAPPVI